jgi:serine/threonine protein kinase
MSVNNFSHQDPETRCSSADTKTEEANPALEPEFYAVKLQSKYGLIKGAQEGHLHNEIELMSQMDHPLILKMKGVSQDKRIIYMYVEFIESGDLMRVLNHYKKLPIAMSIFYAAQIVLCFEYIHSKNMLFRDLKPENVLVTKDGYLKLADFGFIKRLNRGEKTYTFCGTPEYIAPEIISNGGYSSAVDWYSLGIMIYELLYGRPPYMANDPMDIFKMVLTDKILFPKDFDPNAKSIVKHLCHHDLSKRYG